MGRLNIFCRLAKGLFVHFLLLYMAKELRKAFSVGEIYARNASIDAGASLRNSDNNSCPMTRLRKLIAS